MTNVSDLYLRASEENAEALALQVLEKLGL